MIGFFSLRKTNGGAINLGNTKRDLKGRSTNTLFWTRLICEKMPIRFMYLFYMLHDKFPQILWLNTNWCLMVSVGLEYGHRLAGYSVSLKTRYQPAEFSSGGLTGEGSSSKLTQVVHILPFLAALAVREAYSFKTSKGRARWSLKQCSRITRVITCYLCHIPVTGLVYIQGEGILQGHER